MKGEQYKMSLRKTFCLTENQIENIKAIKEKHHLKTETAAIEFALTETILNSDLSQKLDTIEHELFLLKKYCNELRRNNHILLSLVDAVALKLDIQTVPQRDDKRFRTPAYLSAHSNMREYLDAVMAKNKDAVTNSEELDE